VTRSEQASTGATGAFGRLRTAVRGQGYDPALLAVVALALVVGIALRWMVLHGPLGYVDLDEATVGVQARSLLGHPAVFFPRQPYGGTLETYLVAVILQLWSGPVALKAVPILLHAAAAAVSWRVAVRVVPSKVGQLAVPVMVWVGPSFAVWESTKERGFYGMTILLAATAIWCALWVVDHPVPKRMAVFGLVGGLALWTSPLLALIFVPCGIWSVVRRPALLRSIPVAALGALVGAAPWLVWNVRNGWASLSQPSVATISRTELLTNGLGKVPTLLGAATPWNPSRALWPGAGVTVAVALIAVLAVATWKTREAAPGLLLAVICGFAVIYPFVVTLGATGSDLRYLYPLLPVFAVAIGAVFTDPKRRAGQVLVLSAVVVVAGLTSWWGLVGMERASSRDTLFLAAPGIDETVQFLEDRGIDQVTTDVAGAQITYASGGRIDGASFWVPRFADLQETMRVDAPSAYVLETGRLGNDVRLEQAADARGIAYEKHQFGVWSVYLLDGYLPPWEAGLLVYGGPVTESGAMQTN
jgi:hypothetical protein